MSGSPEQSVPPAQTEALRIEQAKMRERILGDMVKALVRCEAFYLSPEEQVVFVQFPGMTRERYTRFEAWMEELSQKGVCHPEFDQQIVRESVAQVTTLYQALKQLHEGQSLEPGISEQYKPDRWYSFLPGDIPRLTTFPLEYSEKWEGLGVDFAGEEYGGKTLSHFHLIEQDIVIYVGYARRAPERRKELIDSLERSYTQETCMARLFFIEDLFRQRREDPDNTLHLRTDELFEAFDKAGVRPATVVELLAFSKKYHRSLGAQSQRRERTIYALGSSFGSGEIPRLELYDDGRVGLVTGSLDSGWRSDDVFLVVRKDTVESTDIQATN